MNMEHQSLPHDQQRLLLQISVAIVIAGRELLIPDLVPGRKRSSAIKVVKVEPPAGMLM